MKVEFPFEVLKRNLSRHALRFKNYSYILIKICLNFCQITKFIAAGETKLDTKVLLVYSHERFTDADILEAQFLVPQLPPSTLPFCGIIDVSYQIQVISKQLNI
jgi:uncharacterized membrane protein